MSFKKTLFTIVAILALTTTVNATIYETVSSTGGGGGSSSSSGPAGTYLRQEVSIGKNLTMSGQAYNSPSNNAVFTGKLKLADGQFGPKDTDFQSFLFADMMDIFYGDPYNTRIVYAEMNVSFYSHQGMYSDPSNNMVKPTTNFGMQTNVFFPGIDININSHINNDNGGHTSFPNLYFPILEYDTSVSVNNGTINGISISPFWEMNNGKLYAKFFASIHLDGDINQIEFFTSSLQEAPDYVIENLTTIPEPATMCILSLGALFLRRRK